MLDLEFFRHLLRALDISVCHGDQLRFRNSMPQVISVLLAHRTHAQHSYA
jgi:hypothetical protein